MTSYVIFATLVCYNFRDFTVIFCRFSWLGFVNILRFSEKVYKIFSSEMLLG